MRPPSTALVVGGGFIGCFSAYYLARAGVAVTLVERDRLGSGASSGNCGLVCPSHVMPMAAPGIVSHTMKQLLRPDGAVAFRPSAVVGMLPWLLRFLWRCRETPMMSAARARHALLLSSVELYRDFVKEHSVQCQWRDDGLLVAYRSEDEFKAFSKTASRIKTEFELSVQSLEREALLEFEPALNSSVVGGWFFPGDAQVRPDRLVTELKRVLQESGVEIKEGVTVRDVQLTGQQFDQLQTTAGPMQAEVVAFCLGAETPKLVRKLGCHVPIQPGKGYSLTLPAAANAPQRPIIFAEHHVAVTPFDGALRIGSTMEFSGYDRSVNPARLSLLMKSARAHLVNVPPEASVEPWAGWRPMTPDGLPRIAFAQSAKNALVAAGNGMIGLATAPATGRLVADLVMGNRPHVDPKPFALT